MSLSDGPILILSDSMLKGIKEIKLSNKTATGVLMLALRRADVDFEWKQE